MAHRLRISRGVVHVLTPGLRKSFSGRLSKQFDNLVPDLVRKAVGMVSYCRTVVGGQHGGKPLAQRTGMGLWSVTIVG